MQEPDVAWGPQTPMINPSQPCSRRPHVADTLPHHHAHTRTWMMAPNNQVGRFIPLPLKLRMASWQRLPLTGSGNNCAQAAWTKSNFKQRQGYLAASNASNQCSQCNHTTISNPGPTWLRIIILCTIDFVYPYLQAKVGHGPQTA
jgi:hypothetical protein